MPENDTANCPYCITCDLKWLRHMAQDTSLWSRPNGQTRMLVLSLTDNEFGRSMLKGVMLKTTQLHRYSSVICMNNDLTISFANCYVQRLNLTVQQQSFFKQT
ncbi:hypothetical protein F2P81_014038 [Scophthalmus maximus]|uniref:Uncharacterized protein n=1 Tax=Scophthalmus maximus TaxID=52904 RepID=A0A6A4SV61_SCOMX|nr:hypothetical protein F2P81_014038 [Scophthalmus maximus]